MNKLLRVSTRDILNMAKNMEKANFNMQDKRILLMKAILRKIKLTVRVN